LKFLCYNKKQVDKSFSNLSLDSAADAVDILRAMQSLDNQELTQFETWLEAIMVPTERPICHE
jgi:hypothetical protein